MIEEIKKEINKKVNDYFWKQKCENEETFVKIKKIYNGVLDKYNNQEKQTTIFIDSEDMEERYGTQLYIEYLEKYKKAWEELENKRY